MDDFVGSGGNWANRVTINVSYPLFRGGRDFAAINAAVSDEEAAKQALSRAKEEVRAEEEAAIANMMPPRRL